MNYVIGFSQVFFDCPQSLCIDGGIDEITNDKDENFLIFYGKYYWHLTENSSTVEISKSKPISESYEKIGTYLNAVTINTQTTYFFKV